MFGTWARVIAAIVLVGLLGALGVGVYQAGFVAGAATEGATVVAPYAYGWGGGWGIGHGFFGFFGTLLVIIIIFGLLRAIFWRGPRWGGGWGYGRHYGPGGPDGFRGSPWEDRAREVHDEWHRRQGGEGSTGSSGSAGGSSGSGGSTGSAG